VNVLKPYLDNTVIALLRRDFAAAIIARLGWDRRRSLIRRQLAAAVAWGGGKFLHPGHRLEGHPRAAENPHPGHRLERPWERPIPPPVAPGNTLARPVKAPGWIEAQVRPGAQRHGDLPGTGATRAVSPSPSTASTLLPRATPAEPCFEGRKKHRLDFSPGEFHFDTAKVRDAANPEELKYPTAGPRLFIMTCGIHAARFRKTVGSRARSLGPAHEEAIPLFHEWTILCL